MRERARRRREVTPRGRLGSTAHAVTILAALALLAAPPPAGADEPRGGAAPVEPDVLPRALESPGAAEPSGDAHPIPEKHAVPQDASRDGFEPPARTRTLKLWPFFEYRTDAAAGTRTLKLLGPLLEYRSDPDFRSLAFRPLLSIRQARAGHDDEVRILYPLIVSRWLVAYETATEADGRSLLRQRVRAFPVYAYDWEAPAVWGRLSLAPFYVDLEDEYGYERVQAILFPAYLRLREPDADRRYLFFPFVGGVAGEEASGVQLWPLYARRTVGERYDGGFAFWPFYTWSAEARDGGTERRAAFFPFYSRLAGPARERTTYGALLYTHAVDRDAGRESWGFPWPLWTRERDLASGRQTALRLFPLWADYTDLAAGPGGAGHRTRALLPGFRAVRDAEGHRGNVPALLDALEPRDAPLAETWAPFWSAYAWDGTAAAPRWSVAWEAVTHAGGETIYPWRFDR
jgi:hypothetical protein